VNAAEGPIALSAEELAILDFTGDLHAEEESPLAAVLAVAEDAMLEEGARKLVARGLAEKVTLRPQRELSRRLLAVAQPDARVVLMERDGKSTRRAVEYYERAGAFVPYTMRDGLHVLGTPVDFDEVLRTVLARLPTRASRGDFVDFTVSASEYFALSLFAGETVRAARSESLASHRDRSRVRVEGEEPSTARDAQPLRIDDDEGTPIGQLFRQLPAVPRGRTWDETVRALLAKDVIAPEGDGYRLRPYLRDLALALGTKHRTVLTRLDFGADDWIVRDATLIPVPGSLFVVRAIEPDVIRIAELTAGDLEITARYAIEPAIPLETFAS